MSDRAFELCCQYCEHAWCRWDGPQCHKNPHDYVTPEQKKIVEWLRCPTRWCPGYAPNAETRKRMLGDKRRQLEADLADIDAEIEELS